MGCGRKLNLEKSIYTFYMLRLSSSDSWKYKTVHWQSNVPMPSPLTSKRDLRQLSKNLSARTVQNKKSTVKLRKRTTFSSPAEKKKELLRIPNLHNAFRKITIYNKIPGHLLNLRLWNHCPSAQSGCYGVKLPIHRYPSRWLTSGKLKVA